VVLLTYAVIKDILVTKKFLDINLLIELTNPFNPLAVAVDDTALQENYNEAIRRFTVETGSDAYADYHHDVSAVLHLTIANLWKFNGPETGRWFNIARAICEKAVQYKLNISGVTDENSVQEYTPDINSTRFPKPTQLRGHTGAMS